MDGRIVASRPEGPIVENRTKNSVAKLARRGQLMAWATFVIGVATARPAQAEYTPSLLGQERCGPRGSTHPGCPLAAAEAFGVEAVGGPRAEGVRADGVRVARLGPVLKEGARRGAPKTKGATGEGAAAAGTAAKTGGSPSWLTTALSFIPSPLLWTAIAIDQIYDNLGPQPQLGGGTAKLEVLQAGRVVRVTPKEGLFYGGDWNETLSQAWGRAVYTRKDPKTGAPVVVAEHDDNGGWLIHGAPLLPALAANGPHDPSQGVWIRRPAPGWTPVHKDGKEFWKDEGSPGGPLQEAAPVEWVFLDLTTQEPSADWVRRLIQPGPTSGQTLSSAGGPATPGGEGGGSGAPAGGGDNDDDDPDGDGDGTFAKGWRRGKPINLVYEGPTIRAEMPGKPDFAWFETLIAANNAYVAVMEGPADQQAHQKVETVVQLRKAGLKARISRDGSAVIIEGPIPGLKFDDSPLAELIAAGNRYGIPFRMPFDPGFGDHQMNHVLAAAQGTGLELIAAHITEGMERKGIIGDPTTVQRVVHTIQGPDIRHGFTVQELLAMESYADGFAGLRPGMMGDMMNRPEHEREALFQSVIGATNQAVGLASDAASSAGLLALYAGELTRELTTFDGWVHGTEGALTYHVDTKSFGPAAIMVKEGNTVGGGEGVFVEVVSLETPSGGTEGEDSTVRRLEFFVPSGVGDFRRGLAEVDAQALEVFRRNVVAAQSQFRQSAAPEPGDWDRNSIPESEAAVRVALRYHSFPVPATATEEDARRLGLVAGDTMLLPSVWLGGTLLVLKQGKFVPTDDMYGTAARH